MKVMPFKYFIKSNHSSCTFSLLLFMLKMRYHTFKSSMTKNLILKRRIFSSQVQYVGNSWGMIKDVWLFLPSPGEYELVVLFMEVMTFPSSKDLPVFLPNVRLTNSIISHSRHIQTFVSTLPCLVRHSLLSMNYRHYYID